MAYSTDIKDYWRRAWGLKDRPQPRRKYVVGAFGMAPTLAYPAMVGVAKLLGITTAGVGAKELSEVVTQKIQENPEVLETPQAKAIMLAFGLTPSGLVFGPDADAIEKDKEKFRELLKPGKTYVPDNKGWTESFPDQSDVGKKLTEPPVNIPVELPKSEGFPIPERKGWQEFILYNKAIEKKIKDNAPADKEKASDEYLDAVREGIELHDGNIAKAMKIFGLNREYIRAKFAQRGQTLEGKGHVPVSKVEPLEVRESFTDFTTDLKKNPGKIDTVYKEAIETGRIEKDKIDYHIDDVANTLGIDINRETKKGSRNQLLKILEPIRSEDGTYNINEVFETLKSWSSGKKVAGEAVAGSERYEQVFKADAPLLKEFTNAKNKILKLTKEEGTYNKDLEQIEHGGHFESVKTLNKYPKISKNLNTIQDYIFQDPKINTDIIQTKGHAAQMESIYKELSELIGKKNINKELIKIQEKIDARLKKTQKQIREHKEYTIGKNQDKRIARLKINLPKEGEAFTADNIVSDLSKVDKRWIMGNVDIINSKAKKFNDLNKNQKEMYRANLNDQYLEMIGKIYKEVGYGKGEIEDVQETISEGTHEKKGFLEKARGGPILSGVDQYLMNRYR